MKQNNKYLNTLFEILFKFIHVIYDKFNDVRQFRTKIFKTIIFVIFFN